MRVRLVLKHCHDLRSSILRPKYRVIPFVEIEDLPDLFKDRFIDCRANFQSTFEELADRFSTFLHDFVSIRALLCGLIRILSMTLHLLHVRRMFIIQVEKLSDDGIRT